MASSVLLLVPIAAGALLAGCADLTGSRECPPLDIPGACYSLDECVLDVRDPAYLDCGGDVYECHDGTWEVVGSCDKFPLHFVGAVALDQRLSRADPTCPALEPAPHVDLVADPADVLTSADLDVVGDATPTSTLISAGIAFDATDTWGDLDVSLTYRLAADRFGAVTGTADVVAPGCTARVYVTGTASLSAL